jgi:cobalt/nickel transport system permease protein
MEVEWLFEKDKQAAVKDNDQFLDKSILAILKVLAKIRKIGTYSGRRYYRLNGTLKLMFTLINIMLLSLARTTLFVCSADLFLLLSLLLLEKRDRSSILILSCVVPLMTSVMLLPSIISGNVFNSILIILKLFGTVISVNILSYTTKWDHITKALKVFLVEDLFIWIMDITIKYIVILGEHSLNFLYALKLKSVGRNRTKQASLSKVIGNLFLKSKDMSEEMFSAMECRGFTGEYKRGTKFKIGKADVAYSAANMLALVFFTLTAR